MEAENSALGEVMDAAGEVVVAAGEVRGDCSR